ncbi:MAG: DUF86 domain-containing protein [Bacteroidetes bacterium]|nr:DUF86 domain-containing protein [Bacteroidota bacterium]
MYNNKNILYIVSAISAIEKITIYTSNYSNAISLLQANNQLNFNGTITLLIAIAEETKKIDLKLLQTQQDIQWQNIVDMRNVLAHDYRGIDPEILFDVVKNELPKLKNAFIKMIKELPIEAVREIIQTNQYQHLSRII